jgi:tetratricopeptide (TPR) repeat protein
LGRVLSLMGDFEESIAMFRRARTIGGDLPSLVSAMGQTLAVAGHMDEARVCLERLHEIARGKAVHSISFGILHLGLGERGEALTWCERGCDRREVAALGFHAHPLYDPVRSEPRFQALLRRIGFLR